MKQTIFKYGKTLTNFATFRDVFREPVTYWITNPLTKMINNVAAGSDVSKAILNLD